MSEQALTVRERLAQEAEKALAEARERVLRGQQVTCTAYLLLPEGDFGVVSMLFRDPAEKTAMVEAMKWQARFLGCQGVAVISDIYIRRVVPAEEPDWQRSRPRFLKDDPKREEALTVVLAWPGGIEQWRQVYRRKGPRVHFQGVERARGERVSPTVSALDDGLAGRLGGGRDRIGSIFDPWGVDEPQPAGPVMQ